MLSIDTNILLPAVEIHNKDHQKAVAFFQSIESRKDVIISEFVLLELYCLLRNPVVLQNPLHASAAVDVCESFRNHPFWQVLGLPVNQQSFHDEFWQKLRDPNLARRRAFDWRIAHSLVQLGVTEFATVNEKDFRDFGFLRVWNPLI